MSDEAPVRLIASAEDPALRALLEAGRDELATGAQMASLSAKLGPWLGGGGGGVQGGGSGGGAAVAKVASVGPLTVGLMRAAVLALIAAVGSLGAMAVLRDRGRAPVATPAVTASASPVSTAPAPSEVELPAASAKGQTSSAAATPPSVSAPPAAASIASDPEGEVKLLRRAHAELGTDPAEALSLCDAHARRYPRGLLVQESEVIAIDALTRLGRRPEAEARAHRFASTFPTSAHLARIETILGERP